MAIPFDPSDRPTDDALDLFGAETGTPSSQAETGTASAQHVSEASYSQPAATVESASPAAAISFDQIRNTGGIGFVEAIAAVQALCVNLAASAGNSKGVPDLTGVFLTSSGKVVASGPPSGDTAPRELARILHELVTAESMPPAGRLFIGRWSTSDAVSLDEFARELDYFARPNGHELLTSVYARSKGAPVAARTPTTERPVVLPERNNFEILRKKAEERAKHDPNPVRRWMNAHRPETVAAVAVFSSVLITGIVAWVWPVVTPVVAKQVEKIGGLTLARQAGEPANPTGDSTLQAKTRSLKPKAPSSGATRSRKPALVERDRAATNDVTPATPVQPIPDSPVVAEPTVIPSGTVPDLRIYSEADGGVQTPRLRSAGIPDFLLRGFERRTNVVELIISERGEVQQARMVNEPQRMPDIMVLSRVKELLFEPAVRNGVAVRYKMIMKWDVTP